jgi:hypothetical protein
MHRDNFTFFKWRINEGDMFKMKQQQWIRGRSETPRRKIQFEEPGWM